ncbi:MAG: NERD domain-containing protein [Anaerolineae bacterium]|nr:NERD domain-containing protein [Anaerolineae bacterium]
MQDTTDSFNQTSARLAVRRKVSGFFLTLSGVLLMLIGLVIAVLNVFGGGAVQNLLVVGAIILGAVLVVVGAVNFVRGMRTPTTDPLGARLAQTLVSVLDSRHLLLRDHSMQANLVVKPDAVVVGPGGVMVLKLINEPGIFRCENETWLKRIAGRDFQSWKRSPTREIIQELDVMREYLASHQLQNVPIDAFIVFTYPAAEISVRAPAIAVTTLDYLPGELRHGYLLSDRIDMDLLRQTRRLLGGRRAG